MYAEKTKEEESEVLFNSEENYTRVAVRLFSFLSLSLQANSVFGSEKLRMQTRYMERSNSMAREKRCLDSTSTEEDQPERKRPALARYFIFKFFKIDDLYGFDFMFEYVFR